MNKIVAKNRIYTALKYTGGFLVCNILLWVVIWLIAELDQDKHTWLSKLFARSLHLPANMHVCRKCQLDIVFLYFVAADFCFLWSFSTQNNSGTIRLFVCFWRNCFWTGYMFLLPRQCTFFMVSDWEHLQNHCTDGDYYAHITQLATESA